MAIRNKHTEKDKVTEILSLIGQVGDIPGNDARAERFYGLITDDAEDEVVDRALFLHFDNLLNEPNDRAYAKDMWPEFAQRHGFDPAIPGEAKKRKTVRLTRRPWVRVAAVIIPLVFVAAGIANFSFRSTTKTGAGVPENNIPEMVETIASATETILLPDGSEVKLLEGATISYNKDFTDGRQVKINGKASFKVTHDPERPFTVICRDTKVTVLGTEFAVNAFEQELLHEVVVSTGKVSVANGAESVEITANQKATLDCRKNRIDLSEVGDGELMKLLGLGFSLKGHTLDEVFTMASQFFGVKIVVKDMIDLSQKITVDFGTDATIDDVLRIVKLTIPVFDYHTKGNLVVISGR